ncbi:sugar ABC transporter ATP-binding protein, partial [Mesorhizobium sp. M2D.F.Ca.ET.178.01.1.1]
KVLEVVRRQGDAGRAVIFISHRFVEIAALCDRATVLRDGETVGVLDIVPGVEEKIVEMMLGARIEKTSVAAARMASEASSVQDSHPRLVVRNLRLGTK